MSYLYETHLHTCRASACAVATPAEYISFYKKHGFDGIFVTEHFFNGNTSIDRNLPWPEWVHLFTNSYRELKELGDKEDLKVFLGWETTIDGDDYLIYGLDEDFLLSHPDMVTWRQVEQYKKCKAAGGLVIQAHPFRSRDYIRVVHLHPHQCDGFEIANGGNYPYENYLARVFAVKHGLKVTAGSDIHAVDPINTGTPYAIAADKPLNSAEDYVKLILSGEGYHVQVPETAFSGIPIPLDAPIRIYDKAGKLSKISSFDSFKPKGV